MPAKPEPAGPAPEALRLNQAQDRETLAALRHLEAIHPPQERPRAPEAVRVRCQDIVIPEWQREVNEEKVAELAASIRARGVMQPIRVRPHPSVEGAYELVYGQHRLLASLSLGLADIPAVVEPLDDIAAREVALIENLHRGDMSHKEQLNSVLELAALRLGRPLDAVLRAEMVTVLGYVGTGKEVRGEDRLELLRALEASVESLGANFRLATLGRYLFKRRRREGSASESMNYLEVKARLIQRLNKVGKPSSAQLRLMRKLLDALE